MFFLGVEYGRGAAKTPIDFGCENGPSTISKIFADHRWDFITPTWNFDLEDLQNDRFLENLKIQQLLYNYIMNMSDDNFKNHILIGGDHSLNFAHFKAIADRLINNDICLIYIDAHTDIHTPESSRAEASGAPHGTNVRHLLGMGDERFLHLGNHPAPLCPQNLFYIGTRSYEASESKFISDTNIFMTNPKFMNNPTYIDEVINYIMGKIGNKKYIISFDFDVLSTHIMTAVQVPEANGISTETALYILRKFKTPNLISTEFVEYAPSFDKLGTSELIAKLIIENML